MSQTHERKWLALALLAAAQFVVVLDASIVNVALPSIGTALDFSQDNLSWVVNAYTLTFGGFLLLGGRMADLLGRRRLFIAGLVLFAGASLAGGLAQSDVWLIAARAVQGLGAALLSPAALSLVTEIFEEGAERNKALGVWGAVAGSGGAAGVLLGGMLTQWAGWEWVLFVNVPIGLAAAFLAPRLLPESRNEGARHFDIAGAVTVTAGLSLLVYSLVNANSAGWASTETLVLFAVAVVLLVAFVLIELRTKAPLVPFPGIFRVRTIRGINVTGLLIAMALFSMFFFISLYMQQVLGYDALKAGVAYLPLAVGIIISAGLASTLITKLRRQAGARARPAPDRDRPVLVRPDLAGRHLRRRHPVPGADLGLRARVRVRADDGRRRGGRRAARGGPRVRPDQHVAAGRRRARPRDPGRDRQLAHRLAGRVRQLDAGRAHRGLPDRAAGRRRASRSSARSSRFLLVDGREVEEHDRGRRRWCRSRRSDEGAPDVDLERAGLDPERELAGIELDTGGGESRLRSFSAVAGERQAGGVPAERAEARVLPVVPQRAARPC